MNELDVKIKEFEDYWGELPIKYYDVGTLELLREQLDRIIELKKKNDEGD